MKTTQTFFLVLIFFSIALHSQTFINEKSDTTKPTQYRRGVELQEGYQSYDEKYFGKNLNDEKKSLFPLQDGTGVWTELNPKVPRVDYLGIGFVNKDTGWAVGDLGALIKTTDGGNSWSVSETNITTPLLKVKSYNGQTVIACGFSGLILRSTDGGENFEQITTGVTGDLWGLQMLNDTLGWACGNFNSLIKTTDDGQSWQQVVTPGYTANYWWIDFLNKDYGFIAADGKVLKTTDGGTNWEIIQAGDDYPLFSIDVIDSLHIAASGYGGTSYRGKNIYSSDGGYTWINGGPLTFEAVNDIKYINRDTGYVMMTNVIARKTTNRGQEWTGIIAGGEYEMQFFELQNIGYSAGTELRIYKTENNFELWNRLIINDNFADVFFVTEEKGFAISSSLSSTNNGLYYTSDEGINWEILIDAPSGSTLFFLDSMTGFIGNYTIFKTTNGAENWATTNLTVTGEVRKIFFINSTTGWAATQWSPSSKAKILKTTDRGENWSDQITQSGSDSFTSLFFSDSLNGWATSRFIWQTTNGGNTWIQRTDIPAFFGTDIFFQGNNGYVIEQLKLFKSENYGLNWVTQLNSQYIIRNFGWLSDTHGFVIGDGVYESIDSGNGWQEILELRNTGLRKIHAPNNYLGYAVGNSGLIFRYLDTTIVPVELISLEGQIENNKIILKWLTASELNNRGFEIEKSIDKENWFNIGFVEGNGTSADINYYSFIDTETTSGIQFYRLKQVDYDWSFEYSKMVEVQIGVPKEFSLSQNYPNPFNPLTTINFILKLDSKITLKIFDVLGKEITSLINEDLVVGYYNIEFNASAYPSGVYFFKLRAEAINGEIFQSTKKMILIK